MNPAPEVRQAEELDSAGRHSEAIDALARAVKRDKDLEAMTRLGKRLLVGDRAPALPREGTGFLAEAAQLGGAEAAARLAVLLAMGAYTEANWHGAAECLMLAAQRGWQPAREQLMTLAEDRRLAESARGSEDPATWQALVENIDFGYWLNEPPAGRTLNQEPLVRAYADFATGPACAWLIAKAKGRLRRAEVYDPVNETNKVDKHRSNSAFTINLLDTDMVNVLVQARMAISVGLPFRHLEAAAVLHYAPGQQIAEHYDFVDPNIPNYREEIARRGQRVVTFLLYLNDTYGGGETDFPKLGVSHRGKLGEGLFFVNSLPDGSSDLRTVHAGRPPRDGEKWIVSQFIRNRPTY